MQIGVRISDYVNPYNMDKSMEWPCFTLAGNLAECFQVIMPVLLATIGKKISLNRELYYIDTAGTTS